MQLQVELHPINPTLLPFSYYSYLGAVVYQSINRLHPALAQELHDGEDFRNRIKLFGISPLTSKEVEVRKGGSGSHLPHAENHRGLIFKGRTVFRIFSPLSPIMTAIGEGLLAESHIRIGTANFHITGVTIIPAPTWEEKIIWRPVKEATFVTSWNKPEKPEGIGQKRSKHYVLPAGTDEEHRFCENLIKENIVHKWQRLTDPTGNREIAARWVGMDSDPLGSASSLSRDPSGVQTKDLSLPQTATLLIPDPLKAWIYDQSIEVRIDRPVKTRLHQVKHTPVRSWSAPVIVTTPEAIQRLIWSCGLGEMNSMGFGGVETLNMRNQNYYD